MTIETKFKPGDKVWAMVDNKPSEEVVFEIDVAVREVGGVYSVIKTTRNES